jgi:hypothetical protein
VEGRRAVKRWPVVLHQSASYGIGGEGGAFDEGKMNGRGEDGAAVLFRVEWRGVGGEPVAGGE